MSVLHRVDLWCTWCVAVGSPVAHVGSPLRICILWHELTYIFESINMCVYMYIYIYMYTYTHVYIHIYVYIYMYKHTYICSLLHTWTLPCSPPPHSPLPLPLPLAQALLGTLICCCNACCRCFHCCPLTSSHFFFCPHSFGLM